jgi:hypothetical protein
MSLRDYEIHFSTKSGYHHFTTQYGVEYALEVLDHSDWYGLPPPKFEGII